MQRSSRLDCTTTATRWSQPRCCRAANWLRGLGVRRGDRVLLMLPNVPPLWEVMLACMKLGAVVMPATTLLVVSLISLAFIIFAATLFYGERASRNVRN